MRRKRLIAWLLSCVMLLTLFPFAGAAAYQDTEGHWAEDIIDKWSNYGVLQGSDEGFAPDEPIIRGDMAVIIDRLMDYQSKADNTFSDLGQAYYTDAVLRAAQAGVMEGSDGKVRPEEYITREEAVCMLARAMSVAGGNGSSGFADDASISSWAKSNVISFAQKGYINGQPGNLFAPQDNITRAEVIQVLDNMISDYITEAGTVTEVGNGIVIVKAAGVTLDGVQIQDNLVLGGLADTVIAKNCDLSGKTVCIAQSALKAEGTTDGGSSSSKVAAPYTYTDYDNYTDPFYPDTTGTFTVTQYVALFSDTSGATIKYTLDGSDPKTSDTAKEFDQTKYKAASGMGGAEVDALITIGADTGDDWDGSAKQTKVTLKAYASKAGMEDSDVVTFEYTIDRMSKNEHKSRLLYNEGGMKVWQVIDYDSDKMYLIKVKDRALLIDAGMAPGTAESLYEYAKTLAGTEEVDLYISHGHPDHTTQIGDFVEAGRKVYIHEEDVQMALGFINENVDEDEGNNLTADIFTTIDEGYQFDLGGVTLDNYYVPGHTPGSMLLLDKAHNILYSSDAVGCNRRSVADSLTLASNDVRVLLSSVQVFKDKMLALDTAGEIDLDKLVTWTGHDDYEINDLIGHLDTVIEAAQNIVDYGPDAAMRKSVRDTGGSDGASIAGDRYANDGTGHFICMNGKKSTVLSGENYTTVAELANLKVTAAGDTDNLMTGFSTTHAFEGTTVGDANVLVAEVASGTQSVDVYPTAMATKAKVTVGGQTVARGSKVTIALNNGYKEIPIVVTAPDGKTTASYTLTVRTYIDPMNPYKTMYVGKHTETVKLDNGETRTFTSYVPEGARESNAGIFILPDQGKNSFDAWKKLADNTDTQAIDEEWTKQQEKFIVVYLDSLTYGESEKEREADIDYVNKVYAAASGRTMYCIHEAKNYMVGYGEGGTIAQMAAMDQTAVWAGLATVGAGDVDEAWIETNGKEMASSLNGYNDQSNSTRKSEIQKSTLPLPVWIINDNTKTDEATLQYWLTANKIGEDEHSTGSDAVTKYVRTKDWQDNADTGDYETRYGDNRDKEAYRVWVSSRTMSLIKRMMRRKRYPRPVAYRFTWRQARKAARNGASARFR